MKYLNLKTNILNNNNKTIIYLLNLHQGGLCDFFKFCMHTIYLCEKYNYNLKIYVNTYLKKFININSKYLLNNNEINYLNEEKIFQNQIYYLKYYNNTNNTIENILNNYKNKYLIIQPTNFHTLKNIYFHLPVDLNFKDYITNKNIKNYFNILNFINFNKDIYNKLDNCLTENNLIKNNYICIHLRCGDKYLETKPLLGYCVSDVRFKNINIYQKKIKKTLSENENTKILFLCDNNVVKKIIKSKINNENLIILNNKIIHVGYKYNKNDKNIQEGFIDTLVDFLLLIYSKKNYCLSYSGFSIISSLLGNKELINL